MVARENVGVRLQRCLLAVKIGGLLEFVPNSDKACFIKMPTHQLQADREVFCLGKAAGNRHRRYASEVGGDGINIRQIHL